MGASTIGFDGVLYMNTQLMDENIELANQLMDEQLKKIKEGLIPNELLEGAKLMIANLLSIHVTVVRATQFRESIVYH